MQSGEWNCEQAIRGSRVARSVHQPEARGATEHATDTAYDTVEEAHAGKKTRHRFWMRFAVARSTLYGTHVKDAETRSQPLRPTHQATLQRFHPSHIARAYVKERNAEE